MEINNKFNIGQEVWIAARPKHPCVTLSDARGRLWVYIINSITFDGSCITYSAASESHGVCDEFEENQLYATQEEAIKAFIERKVDETRAALAQWVDALESITENHGVCQ